MMPELEQRVIAKREIVGAGQPEVKICGLRTPEDILVAAELGADYFGMVIDFPQSPRSLNIEEAARVASAVRDQNTAIAQRLVGVFVDKPLSQLLDVVSACGLRTVQLHGNESPGYCDEIRSGGVKVWKAFRVNSQSPESIIAGIEPYIGHIDQILLDAYSPQRSGGGLGKTFNVEIATVVQQKYGPVILAGGLTPTNIERAAKSVRPLMVDVSSGVESAPGVKDITLIQYFIEVLRGNIVDTYECTSEDGLVIPYYLAKQQANPETCFLFIPGGVNGGMYEKKTDEFDPLYPALLSYVNKLGAGGCVLARRGSYHPRRLDLQAALDMASDAEVADVVAVVKELRNHGYKRVVAVGNSRGALTSARVLQTRECPLDAAVLISGFYDIRGQDDDDLIRRPESLPTRQSMGCPADQFPYRERSPVFSAEKSAPIPILLLHGENDDIVNVSQAVNMHCALSPHNKRVGIHIYDDLPHVKTVLDPRGEMGEKVWSNICIFLRNTEVHV